MSIFFRSEPMFAFSRYGFTGRRLRPKKGLASKFGPFVCVAAFDPLVPTHSNIDICPIMSIFCSKRIHSCLTVLHGTTPFTTTVLVWYLDGMVCPDGHLFRKIRTDCGVWTSGGRWRRTCGITLGCVQEVSCICGVRTHGGCWRRTCGVWTHGGFWWRTCGVTPDIRTEEGKCQSQAVDQPHDSVLLA